jgi:hypothetical protein
VAYFCGFIPADLINDFDQKFLRVRPRASKTWAKALEKGVLVFSDQQIITGIAVLIAGFIQMGTISVYPWQIVVDLAWMSSNVHLTSLTFLSNYSLANHTLRTCRMVGMLALFGLLLAALVPTVDYTWLNAISNTAITTNSTLPERNTSGVAPNGRGGNCFLIQLPAHCFLKTTLLRATSGLAAASGMQSLASMNTDAVVSYCFLAFGYLWKGSMLFSFSRQTFTRWTKEIPLRCLRMPMQRLARRQRQTKQYFMRWVYRLGYCLLMSGYAVEIACLNLFASFAGSLLIVAIGLAWGTIAIFNPRALLPSGVRDQEDTWSFGQILPVLLLTLPLLAVSEHCLGMCPVFTNLADEL